jgi:hypothetical protein
MSKRAAPQSRGKANSGGGLRGNKVRNVGIRTGPPRTNVVSVQAASELGQRTAFAKPDLYKGTAAQVPMGNETSANIKCGPGGGRTIYKTGFQQLSGPVSQGEGKIGGNAGKDILSEFGPEKSRG